MNEEQRLHQDKKAEVENVAALEAALDAFTVIRSPSGSTCDFVRLSASHVVGGAAHSLHKKKLGLGFPNGSSSTAKKCYATTQHVVAMF